MEDTNDGGPAFPNVDYIRAGEREVGKSAGGMSLRDYFAGEALKPILKTTNKQADQPVWLAVIDRASVMAYEVADAMIRARG